MLRSGSKALKRGFRVQFNCDLLPTQPIPPTDLAENNFVYFNGQSREGATAGEVRYYYYIVQGVLVITYKRQHRVRYISYIAYKLKPLWKNWTITYYCQ